MYEQVPIFINKRVKQSFTGMFRSTDHQAQWPKGNKEKEWWFEGEWQGTKKTSGEYCKW